MLEDHSEDLPKEQKNNHELAAPRNNLYQVSAGTVSLFALKNLGIPAQSRSSLPACSYPEDDEVTLPGSWGHLRCWNRGRAAKSWS